MKQSYYRRNKMVTIIVCKKCHEHPCACIMVYAVMFHNYDYDGWSTLVKIFGNRKSAETFINDQKRISIDLRKKLAENGEVHMANVDKYYVKLRTHTKLSVEENTEFHRLNKEHCDLEDKLHDDSGIEHFISDDSHEKFEIEEMNLE